MNDMSANPISAPLEVRLPRTAQARGIAAQGVLGVAQGLAEWIGRSV
jgi:hypothetical protein